MKAFLFLFSFLLFSTSYASMDSCLAFYSRKYNDQSPFGLQTFKFNLDYLEIKFGDLGSKLKEIDDRPIAFLRLPLSAEDDAKLMKKADLFLKSDTRVLFFKLQSLSRIYEKHYDDHFFQKQIDFFKNFEDLIGKVDLWHSMWALGTKIHEPRLTRYFLNLKRDATINMINQMERQGLVGDPHSVFRDLFRKLKRFKKWEKPDKDLAIHYKQIAKEFRKLNDKILTRTFTNDDIELGLHELRRRLRWPLIHTQVLNRLTKYDSKSRLPGSVQAFFDHLQTANPQILKSGFLKMDPADIKNPIVVPLIPHAIITDLVSSIGSQKDKAEGDIYFAEAMQVLGFSLKEIGRVETKILAATNRTQKLDHKALAEQVQADLESSGVLLAYADLLESLN